MRLSVNLEEPHYRAAKALAQSENISLSRAVNKLISLGFERAQVVEEPESDYQSFPVSKGARRVTSDMIEALENDE